MNNNSSELHQYIENNITGNYEKSLEGEAKKFFQELESKGINDPSSLLKEAKKLNFPKDVNNLNEYQKAKDSMLNSFQDLANTLVERNKIVAKPGWLTRSMYSCCGIDYVSTGIDGKLNSNNNFQALLKGMIDEVMSLPQLAKQIRDNPSSFITGVKNIFANPSALLNQLYHQFGDALGIPLKRMMDGQKISNNDSYRIGSSATAILQFFIPGFNAVRGIKLAGSAGISAGKNIAKQGIKNGLKSSGSAILESSKNIVKNTTQLLKNSKNVISNPMSSLKKFPGVIKDQAGKHNPLSPRTYKKEFSGTAKKEINGNLKNALEKPVKPTKPLTKLDKKNLTPEWKKYQQDIGTYNKQLNTYQTQQKIIKESAANAKDLAIKTEKSLNSKGKTTLRNDLDISNVDKINITKDVTKFRLSTNKLSFKGKSLDISRNTKSMKELHGKYKDLLERYKNKAIDKKALQKELQLLDKQAIQTISIQKGIPIKVSSFAEAKTIIQSIDQKLGKQLMPITINGKSFIINKETIRKSLLKNPLKIGENKGLYQAFLHNNSSKFAQIAQGRSTSRGNYITGPATNMVGWMKAIDYNIAGLDTPLHIDTSSKETGVLFETGVSDIDESKGNEIINKVLTLSQGDLNNLKGKTIIINGIASPTGSFESNKRLARERADKTKEYIKTKLKESSIDVSNIQFEPYTYTASGEDAHNNPENYQGVNIGVYTNEDIDNSILALNVTYQEVVQDIQNNQILDNGNHFDPIA